jgi:hypothetical protein
MQEVVEEISRLLAVDEDNGTSRRDAHEQVNETSTLGSVLGEDELLGNEGMSRPDTTDTNANVIILKILLGKLTSFLGEGSREQHVTMISIFVIVYLKLERKHDERLG